MPYGVQLGDCVLRFLRSLGEKKKGNMLSALDHLGAFRD